MFSNKEEFKEIYQKRMIERYGCSLEDSHKTEQYLVLGEVIRDSVGVTWRDSKKEASREQCKQVFYFSMEFLLGRLLTNNLMNLGIYDIIKEGLADFGIDINDLENMESDAGLGNGGLGRLAACFMDSAASNNYPVHGNSIRYEYGLFKQLIEYGRQIEIPDQWLKVGNVWEIRKPKHGCDVAFYGHIEQEFKNDRILIRHKDAEHVRAVPYDMPIIGEGGKTVNTLRLWSAEASDIIPKDTDFRTYISSVNEICQNVYPDDSTEHGKYLRLKQEYFFVSAGLQEIIKSHLRTYDSLDNLAEKAVIQLNDTHPALCVPELMRLLMDYYDYSWDRAYDITCNTLAYTNHTILAEAFEKWPVDYFKILLPRIWMIVDEIDKRTKADMRRNNVSDADYYRMSIVRDGVINMANLCCQVCFSVNGVARIHTDILKSDVLKEFNSYYPYKLNNKTNGITHRRWLLYSNPQLTSLIEKTIGPDFRKDITKLEDLMNYCDDDNVINEFFNVKRERKEIMARYVKNKLGFEIDPDSIFDVQAKRLHAYKRQLLSIMNVIYLYQRMKEDKDFRIYPHTYLYAAKAAPAYKLAKEIIRLIYGVARIVNNDPETNRYLKVVFVPNYNVSIAEILLNSADVSEQISTAGKEASGTGNMKFMMNGAMTLGTLDGAVVEMDEKMGRENDIIFGHTVSELKEMKYNYNARSYYENDERIKKVMDSLLDPLFDKKGEPYRLIYDDLLYKNDEYFVLADFDAYVKAQEEVERRYQNRHAWGRSMLINIAKSHYFSSDRTIREYCEDIWHVKPMNR